MSPLTWSVPEAARQLGVSRNTLYDLIRAGAFPHVRIGNRIRIPATSLAAWLNQEAERSTR